MSFEYDRYLREHKFYVNKALDWLKEHLSKEIHLREDSEEVIRTHHDWSKDSVDEYRAYDAYFYGVNRSFNVVNDFKVAWLHHIHASPHHWQHWVLINDEPNEGTVALKMPDDYVIEMICDWWSFSHKSGKLYEIFDWYDKHKSNMILHNDTRTRVEYILSKIRSKLDELRDFDVR